MDFTPCFSQLTWISHFLIRPRTQTVQPAQTPVPLALSEFPHPWLQSLMHYFPHFPFLLTFYMLPASAGRFFFFFWISFRVDRNMLL